MGIRRMSPAAGQCALPYPASPAPRRSRCPGGSIRGLLAGCGALLVIAGCGGGDGDPLPPEPPAVATTVNISPASASFTAVGDQQQFQATVLDQNGRAMTGVTVAWESTHPQIVAIDRASGLATSTGPGQAEIRARAGRVGSDVPVAVTQVPRALENAEGDGQQGFLGEKLPVSPAVRVVDANGNPASRISVTFAVTSGGGSISPESTETGTDGIARTEWLLGEDSVQTLRATVESLTTDFTVTGVDAPLEILTNALPQGRVTLPYLETLSAKGGSRKGYMWSLAEGTTLTAGLEIGTDGILQGTPEEAGVSEVELRLTDSKGNEARVALGLRVCHGPLGLALGDVRIVDPAALEPCGFFLRADTAGAYYRVTFASLDGTGESSRSVDLVVEEMPGSAAAAVGQIAALRPPAEAPGGGDAALRTPDDLPAPDIDWSDIRQIERANAELHRRVRRREAELHRELSAEGSVEILPNQPAAQLQRASTSPVTFKISDNFSCRVDTTLVTDVIAENDHFTVYESVEGGSKVSVDNAQALIDFYSAHGVEVIEDYFGGVSDVNGDGRIALLVDPTLPGVQAYVWSADMTYSATQCAASNQRELVHMTPGAFRFSGNNYWALSALVHEVKHVSSLYKRTINQRRRGNTGSNVFHPVWIEEGTAEIAKEMSSRLAWERAGGPGRGDRVDGDMLRLAFREAPRESYGVRNLMDRTVDAFHLDPNAVTYEIRLRFSVYGSGWHFHRLVRDWLAGAGGETDPSADRALVTALNDSLTVPGVEGLEAVTGVSVAQLLQNHGIAMTVAGSEPWLTDERTPRFLAYDFPTATEIFVNPDPPGRYPWPVTLTGDDDASAVAAAVLGQAGLFRGLLGDSGVRMHDFEAMAAGAGAIFHAGVPTDVAVIVARIAKPPGF